MTLTGAPQDRLRLLLLLPQLQRRSPLGSLTVTLPRSDLPGSSTVLQQEALRCTVTSQNTETG